MSNSPFIGISGRKRGRPRKENCTPDIPINTLTTPAVKRGRLIKCKIDSSSSVKRGRPIKCKIDSSSSDSSMFSTVPINRQHPASGSQGRVPLRDLMNTDSSMFLTVPTNKQHHASASQGRVPLRDFTNTDSSNFSTVPTSREHPASVSQGRVPLRDFTNTDSLSQRRQGKQPVDDHAAARPPDTISQQFIPRNLAKEFQNASSDYSLAVDDNVDYENIEFTEADIINANVEDDITITVDSFADYIPEQLYTGSDDDDDDDDDEISDFISNVPSRPVDKKQAECSTSSQANDTFTDKRFATESSVPEKNASLCPEYKSLGAPNVKCPHCHAWMWNCQ